MEEHIEKNEWKDGHKKMGGWINGETNERMGGFTQCRNCLF